MLARTKLIKLEKGKAGTRQTLRLMSQLVKAGKKNMLVRQLALRLIDGKKQKDRAGEIKKIHAFVRDRIRYVRDIRGVETIHSAQRILKQRQGDCDDKSILLASLLESIGHATRFVAVGFKPGVFHHVLVQTTAPGRWNSPKWLNLETTEPVKPGWKPANVVSRMVVHN